MMIRVMFNAATASLIKVSFPMSRLTHYTDQYHAKSQHHEHVVLAIDDRIVRNELNTNGEAQGKCLKNER